LQRKKNGNYLIIDTTCWI